MSDTTEEIINTYEQKRQITRKDIKIIEENIRKDIKIIEQNIKIIEKEIVDIKLSIENMKLSIEKNKTSYVMGSNYVYRANCNFNCDNFNH